MLVKTLENFVNLKILAIAVLIAAWYSPNIYAQEPTNAVSPTYNINHPPNRGREELPATASRPDGEEGPGIPLRLIRTIDGSSNNLSEPELGATFTRLRRLIGSEYSDSIADIATPTRPGPRVISNTISAQQESNPDPLRTSDFLWQWGQFLDHDMGLTDGADPSERVDVQIPPGDPFFDPQGTGSAFLPFNRSIYDNTTGLRPSNPRQQLNEITTWIDTSNVYGSDATRASTLRSNDGSGRMKMSEGNLLPFNTTGLPNAGGSSKSFFLAGDVRANEQVGLTALHTLFVREHNRLAEQIATANPNFSGEDIYQKARQIVGAQIQVISFKEFLPALLGPNAIASYQGYNEGTDPRMANVFTTAAYRWGHSALNSNLLRLQSDGQPIAAGNLALRDAFFSPQRVINEGGIDPILRGLAGQVSQNIDTKLVDDVRNFLFGAPSAGGFDLASLNIQRGRDHGLPSYNNTREKLGLSRAENFSSISSDPQVIANLESAYETVDDIDVWVGGLSENHLQNAHVGRLFFTIIKSQFEALRGGDRLWYQQTLSPEEITEVENTRLADIIRRNTEIDSELSNDVFHVSSGFGQF